MSEHVVGFKTHLLPKAHHLLYAAPTRAGRCLSTHAAQVWVSNHTSMIDYTILCAHSPFAVIMQLQTGWVRFLQTRVLNSLGCLWFNRTDLKVRDVCVAHSGVCRRTLPVPFNSPVG